MRSPRVRSCYDILTPSRAVFYCCRLDFILRRFNDADIRDLEKTWDEKVEVMMRALLPLPRPLSREDYINFKSAS